MFTLVRFIYNTFFIWYSVIQTTLGLVLLSHLGAFENFNYNLFPVKVFLILYDWVGREFYMLHQLTKVTVPNSWMCAKIILLCFIVIFFHRGRDVSLSAVSISREWHPDNWLSVWEPECAVWNQKSDMEADFFFLSGYFGVWIYNDSVGRGRGNSFSKSPPPRLYNSTFHVHCCTCSFACSFFFSWPCKTWYLQFTFWTVCVYTSVLFCFFYTGKMIHLGKHAYAKILGTTYNAIYFTPNHM